MTGKYIEPTTSFVFDKEEKREFCKILKDLKLPSSFSSNLSNIITPNPPCLHSMKSHDYHVILQYLLPVLLQHAFSKHADLRRAIQQISLFFNLHVIKSQLESISNEPNTWWQRHYVCQRNIFHLHFLISVFTLSSIQLMNHYCVDLLHLDGCILLNSKQFILYLNSFYIY